MAQNATGMVSVIIPFLNEEKVLAEAIESVLHQTYRNWELILVDDGSTDQSCDIAKGYAKSYPLQIRYFDHDDHRNRGISFSRNLGIEKANGDLIAFLDADDVWMKYKLTFQVELFRINPRAAMVCEASEYWFHQWDDPTMVNIVKQIGKQRDRLFEPPELLRQLYPPFDGCAPCPSGVIVRRNIALKHGGFETHFSGITSSMKTRHFFTRFI
jgi:glycosyltransferase involved in cell wall biosynthesis